MPARLSTRRCRLMAGRLVRSAAAMSPGRRGWARNSEITARRVGSASAANVPSRSALTLLAQALHEPPAMALDVDRHVAAIGPVVVAVVGRGRLLGDGGP